MARRPLIGGNKVELLRDGPATHDAQLAAIRKARDHVHLITYILTDGELGQDYLKALAERRRHGVKVRLMFDAMGGRQISDEFRAKLDKAGIEVQEFGNVNPMKSGTQWHGSHRDHRKLLVVDGKVAFTGGVNISDEYTKDSSQKGASSPGSDVEGWRDTHIRIEGPAVAEFQRLFFDTWQEDHEKIKPSARYWPKLSRKGDEFVRAVTQQGDDLAAVAIEPLASLIEAGKTHPENAIYASYLAAMTSSRERIWITQAYFIPNREFIEVLAAAARRGVDVRVLVPGQSDIAMMVQASRFHYQPLLEAGAHVYEYKDAVMHAKTAVVDGVWATVGSSNLDYRSFIHNDEANAIIIGHRFGEEMQDMFLDDLARADEIQRAQWEQRPWRDRARQRLAVLFKYWI
jgi:cardiolipin synthase